VKFRSDKMFLTRIPKSLLVTALICIVMISPVFASSMETGGTIRFDWKKPLNYVPSQPYNSFDISRAYLDFRSKLDAGASVRLTLDVSRIPGASSQSLYDHLKYAYVDLPVDLASEQAVPFSLTAKIGLQHTCWIDWSGKIWRFENVIKAYSDVNKNSISSSADFGIGAAGSIVLPSMPKIEYHATVLNGQGYAAAENNSAKDIAFRLNSQIPISDIGTAVLGGYVGVKNGLFAAGTPASTQSGFLIGLKQSGRGNIYFEYLNDQKDFKAVNGFSVGGFFYPSKAAMPAGVLARYDIYDTDTSVENNETKTTVLGVFYDWGENLTMSADLTTTQTMPGAEQKIAALRSEVRF